MHIPKIMYPAGNCMFKVNSRNTRTRCEICSKLTIKTPERRLVHKRTLNHLAKLASLAKWLSVRL